MSCHYKYSTPWLLHFRRQYEFCEDIFSPAKLLLNSPNVGGKIENQLWSDLVWRGGSFRHNVHSAPGWSQWRNWYLQWTFHSASWCQDCGSPCLMIFFLYLPFLVLCICWWTSGMSCIYTVDCCLCTKSEGCVLLHHKSNSVIQHEYHEYHEFYFWIDRSTSPLAYLMAPCV